MAVTIKIFRLSFCVFACAFPKVISSIFGKSFSFPFPYFVLFVLQYFPFHMVFNQSNMFTGENQSLPPMPILYILSHQGVLCLFHAVNLKPNAPCICSPPQKLPDESGLTLFTTSSAEINPGSLQISTAPK